MRKTIYVTLFLLSLKSNAVPTLYPDQFSRFKNTTNSGVLADSVDSRRFYVLPPGRSELQVQGLHTVTANVGFCKEISNIQNYNLDTLELINSLKKRQAQLQFEAEQIQDLLLRLQAEKRYGELESVRRELDDKISSLRQLQADLRELYVEFISMFDAHAQREGGRVAVDYDSGWSENIFRLQKENPHLSFEKIVTKNVQIKADAYSKKNLIVGGAVLAFDVGGMSANGVLSLDAFPEAFSGNAVLNLLSVCPMLHPEWFNITDADIVDRQKMNFGLSVAYQYPSEFKYELSVTYNLYKMYEIVKNQGVSGGFLNSRSWSDRAEQEIFKDGFVVDWKVQSDGQVFSEEKKLAISSDIRRQMLSRLAGHLVMNDKSVKLEEAPAIPDNGAMVLSNSISKNCPFNLLCKGASLMLNVVHAVFRSNQSEQKLRQETDVNMTEHYRSRQVILQPMLAGYW